MLSCYINLAYKLEMIRSASEQLIFNVLNYGAKNSMVNNINKLADLGIIKAEDLTDLKIVTDKYSLSISEEMINLIKKGKKYSAISKQFMPSLNELKEDEFERSDPIGDEKFSPIKGIVHRYKDRVLLKTNSACAVYCRFCFRREVVGPSGEKLTQEETNEAIKYIRKHKDVWEVILTGGDPFVLSPEKIGNILDSLDTINHVKIIRFHTRVPIVKPRIISENLLKVLSNRKATIYIAIHINHESEMTEKAKEACDKLAKKGFPLIGQTVLLKGINNKTSTLEKLFRIMLQAKIKPYYLHHPDFANGTGHFRVTIKEGQKIMRELRGSISGIAIPTYILDIPGGYGKVPIGPQYLKERNELNNFVEDINGRLHIYPSK